MDLTLSLAGIIILGILAQWLAWRFQLPSILLMLVFGFVAGPLTGLLKPDEVLGDLLFPFVSLSVAIILFEGGLSLKISELRPVRSVVLMLVSVGALITWLLSVLAAQRFLNLELPLALLFGAILIVSGPTVIIPLIIQIRPIGKVGSVIKWEGIVNDPVGAIVAVLVFDAIRTSGFLEARNLVMVSLVKSVLIGVAFGVLGAVLLVILLRNYWVPDFLQNMVSLMIVIGVFTASDIFQTESGLITVTLMGVILANQQYVSVRHIIEFKENLRVLLISALFIILAARLQLTELTFLGPGHFIFLGILILLIRPIAVIVSTVRSELSWNERLFLSWMAPRGIVAAAVSSVFAIELAHEGYAGAERLASLTFLVIIGTVTVYGLTAGMMGQWLKVTQPNPQGALIAGAQAWIRKIAKALQAEGFTVLLIDTNPASVQSAQMEDLPVVQANIASDYILDEINLVGIGRMLAMTSNDEVNSLAVLSFRELFDRSELYQLPPRVIRGVEAVSRPLQGRLLFAQDLTHRAIADRFAAGAIIEKITLSEDFGFPAFKKAYGDQGPPLFLITENRELFPFTLDVDLAPQPGQSILCLIDKPLVGKLEELIDSTLATQSESEIT
jgi:NhaP-type Na+/H+ or K+/H+ antiporter